MSEYIQRKRNRVLYNVYEKQEWLSMYSKTNMVTVNYGISKFNNQTINNTNLLNNSVGNTLNNSLNLVLFDKLASISQETTQLLHHYSIGDFKYISNHLTNARYTQILKLLNETNPLIFGTVNNIYNSNIISVYDEIRLFIDRSIKGLMLNVSQYNNLQDITKLYEDAKKYEEILKDSSKLQAYIDNLNNSNRFIFPESTLEISAPEFDPACMRYFELYGLPDDMKFDEKILDEIRVELKITP